MFFVCGAYSIDKASRTIGKDWWECEELTYTELNAAYDLYYKTKPDIVFSHECPNELRSEIVNPVYGGTTRTGEALQAMFDFHRPLVWIFGHYHISKTLKYGGTEFHCLDCNETYTIEGKD
jgi:Icc-related predicted phosphoesterase